MRRSDFEARLNEAARQAVEFARLLVREELPDGISFRVFPNQSFDGHPLVGDEEVFPGDELPDGRSHGPWSPERAAEFLWRGGKVPEWVDASVLDADGRHAVVALRCCGRFTASDELLYYPTSATRPFSVKSPPLPPDWVSVESSGKFALRWWGRG